LHRSNLWYHTYGTLRKYSQMPDDIRNDPDEEKAEAWPELPPVPELPETPVLKPNLPAREKRSTKDMEKDHSARQMGLAYVLPTALAAPVVLLTLGGWWLDDRFRLSPYCTLSGALLGTVSGFINMIRIAGKMDR
jgi:F0F1-type ATP synthase assembly protein I